jgi:GTPase
VHLVDMSGASHRDPVADLDTVRRELELFQPALAAKPQIVAANKIDAIDPELLDEQLAPLERRARELKLPVYRVSGASGAGIPELLEAMWGRLAAARQSAA